MGSFPCQYDMSGCLSLSSMEFVELLASESMSDSSISGHLKVCFWLSWETISFSWFFLCGVILCYTQSVLNIMLEDLKSSRNFFVLFSQVINRVRFIPQVLSLLCLWFQCQFSFQRLCCDIQICAGHKSLELLWNSGSGLYSSPGVIDYFTYLVFFCICTVQG